MSTQTFTADDLLNLPDDGNRYELVAGVFTMMSPGGSEHGVIVSRLNRRIGNYVEEHQLGEVYGAETCFRIESDPDTVLAPDVAFVCRERIETIGYPPGFFPGAPDLVVEVRSPNDRAPQIEEKVQRWLAAGTQAIWVIDPSVREAVVYETDAEPQPIAADGYLAGGRVLPGFRCTLAELFPPRT